MKHGAHYRQGRKPHHVVDESIEKQKTAKAEQNPPNIGENVDLKPAPDEDPVTRTLARIAKRKEKFP